MNRGQLGEVPQQRDINWLGWFGRYGYEMILILTGSQEKMHMRIYFLRLYMGECIRASVCRCCIKPKTRVNSHK